MNLPENCGWGLVDIVLKNLIFAGYFSIFCFFLSGRIGKQMPKKKMIITCLLVLSREWMGMGVGIIIDS